MSTDEASADGSGVGTVSGPAPRDRLADRRPPLAPPGRWNGLAAALVAADALAVAAVAWGLYGVEASLVYAVAPLALGQAVMHAHRGAYRTRLSYSALSDVPALAESTLVLWCALAALLATWDPQRALAWQVLALAMAVQVVALGLLRAAVYQGWRARAARQPRRALVIGRGADAYHLVSLLQQQPALGLLPVGLVTSNLIPPPAAEGRAPALPVLRDAEDVARALIQNGVQHAVITRVSGSPATAAPEVLDVLRRHHLQVWVVDFAVDEYHWLTAPTCRDHVYGYPAHATKREPVRSPGLVVKRLVDIVLSGTALVVLSPVLAACALAVRWADGPGVLFRQERIGRDGRPFTVLKFRSLKPTDKAESDTRWNVAGDVRLSRVGDFLRRSSLDELPQLWNVLRGDMSLVGPRPERPFFVEQFTEKYPGYAARHRMPVGITGLAQVHGLRGDTSIPDRARFDNRYITTWSLWQDVCVMLRTVASLLRPGGG
ncbi:sugar transferase [Streptomyces sp. NPDC050418]|uniref:sugar transferase n=1 Tax=Streptomyces sp. NPDC050418 TaxID=3365612 RepID=UPI00379BA57B